MPARFELTKEQCDELTAMHQPGELHRRPRLDKLLNDVTVTGVTDPHTGRDLIVVEDDGLFEDH